MTKYYKISEDYLADLLITEAFHNAYDEEYLNDSDASEEFKKESMRIYEFHENNSNEDIIKKLARKVFISIEDK